MRPVDPGHFRSVMGNFATGVTVITATADKTARTLQIVRETGRFGVNVLGAGQEELARLFASKAPEDAKFAGVPHSVHDGLPVIDGTIAWVGCRLERLVDGGDHTIGIGAVESAEAGDGRPLLWFRGTYRA
jgi:flavin reductase (DIM6/NTAB) family NADH-FMN oxidoreductase RutF